jgi:predicted RNase H-like HicB family nuclease
MADGMDYNEVIKNVLVVMDEWIDTARITGREIPKPKGRLMFA